MILHSDISRVNKTGFASLDPLFGSVELQGVAMPFGRNAEVYGEGEPADYVYKVLAGAIRSYKILSDGRRQIVGFYLPGDVFGLSCEDEHSCSAEAVADSQVQVVRRSTLLRVAERDADVAKALWSFTAAELKRSQEHGLLLIKSAQERIAAFLLDMARRLLSKNGGRSSDVASRYRRPSRPHHRDRFADVHPARGFSNHSAARVTPHRFAQPRAAERA